MVKVLGVGDRGVYTINHLLKTGCIGVGLAVFDTSVDSLKSSRKSNKTHLNSGVNSSVIDKLNVKSEFFYISDEKHS